MTKITVLLLGQSLIWFSLVLKIYHCKFFLLSVLFLYRLVGRAVTRSSLEREV